MCLAQDGRLPLHLAAQHKAPELVVQALLKFDQTAAMIKGEVRTLFCHPTVPY